MSHTPLAPVHAVLFDLGRVVIDIDLHRSFDAWARHSRLTREQVQAGYRVDEAYERHETGTLPADDYFAHLREVLGLDCDAALVRSGYNAMLVGEIAETVDLLD